MVAGSDTAVRPGLVSVSFRKLTPREVADLAVRAQLEGIEWGGDIHVPHGDTARAREVAALTRDAGLAVAAYGSYYRVGQSERDGLGFGRVLDTALALGAPLIRVWASAKGSATTDAETRAHIVAESRRIAAEAARQGVAVAFEYHANTLTDTNESAAALLAATADAGMRAYWQPPSGWTFVQQEQALRAMLPFLANVHVYHWIDGERRPLAEGAAPWTAFLAAVGGEPRWALLEFVRGDDPGQLLDDATTLRRWLTAATMQQTEHIAGKE